MTTSFTNADLYKQLDVLREDNFSLKQRQRELILTINQLRSDNESLLESAEGEIKRMSQFIDKFTFEAENNKQKIIADCE